MHEMWQDQLPYYVAGMLSSSQREAIEQHLVECEDCRRALRLWQDVAHAIRNAAAARVLADVPPPLHRPQVPFEHTRTNNGHSSRWAGDLLTGRKDESTMASVNQAVFPHYRIRGARTFPQRVLSRGAGMMLALIVLGGALLLLAIMAGRSMSPENGGFVNQVQDRTPTSPASPTLTPTATWLPPTATPISPGITVVSPTPVPGVSTTPTSTPILPGATVMPPTLVPGVPITATATAIPPMTILPSSTVPGLPDPTVVPPATVLPTTFIPIQGTLTPVPVTVTPLDDGMTLDLTHLHQEWQTWNNDGPATLAMALGYYGWWGDQAVVARWMRPNAEDKSVTPWQLARFVQDHTPYRALTRIGGTTDLLKDLLAAGFPVIVQTGFEPAGESWMGHYVLLVGYDDRQQQFLTFDSYLGSDEGQGRPHPYEAFDEQWRHFNRMLVVIYEPAREMELLSALDKYASSGYGIQTALEAARQETARDPQDTWAWFNMGSSYVALGDYASASTAYDRALALGLPFRMLWYQFGPYEAYYEVGRYDDVLRLAKDTDAVTPYVEETYFWMGMAYMAQDHLDEAFDQFAQAQRLNLNFEPSQAMAP